MGLNKPCPSLELELELDSPECYVPVQMNVSLAVNYSTLYHISAITVRVSH